MFYILCIFLDPVVKTPFKYTKVFFFSEHEKSKEQIINKVSLIKLNEG